MTGRARPSLFARLLLALISLTLLWAPLSHAGPCGHEGGAGVAAVSDVFASEDAAAPGEAGDLQESLHICSCTGCHFHVLAAGSPRAGLAAAPARPKPDLTLHPAAAAPGDLLRPPRN